MNSFKMIAALSVALAGPAFADVTLGTNSGSNCIPFSCAPQGAGTVYQQVYSGGALGAQYITGVSFLSTQSGGVSGSTFTLSVSTTTRGVDALDTSTFDNNLGADNHVVFSDVLAPYYDGTTLTFTFSDGYAFDPADGNLLLDFRATPGVNNFASAFFASSAGDAGGVYSRAQNFGSANNGFGLVTTFVTGTAPSATVPEPASWALMIAGFGLVGIAARRRAMAVA